MIAKFVYGARASSELTRENIVWNELVRRDFFEILHLENLQLKEVKCSMIGYQSKCFLVSGRSCSYSRRNLAMERLTDSATL